MSNSGLNMFSFSVECVQHYDVDFPLLCRYDPCVYDYVKFTVLCHLWVVDSWLVSLFVASGW